MPGDDLAAMLVDCLRSGGRSFQAGDVLALAQKVVSKSEGRIRKLADVVAGPDALRMAEEWPGKGPRQLPGGADRTRRTVPRQPAGPTGAPKPGLGCANPGGRQP